jgi:hypothetical protein
MAIDQALIADLCGDKRTCSLASIRDVSRLACLSETSDAPQTQGLQDSYVQASLLKSSLLMKLPHLYLSVLSIQSGVLLIRIVKRILWDCVHRHPPLL